MPPDLQPLMQECGWTLGLRRSTHCVKARAEGAEWCSSHVKVDARIDRRAKAIAKQAANRLIGGKSVSPRRLRLAGDPRALAEEWWILSGVRQIPPKVRAELLDWNPCAYCGYYRAAEIDHVIPVTQGGLSERENLVPACETCNAEKKDLTPDQWRDRRSREGLPWPPEPLPIQMQRAVDAMLAQPEPPAILSDLVYEALPAGAIRPGSFRDDDRWVRGRAALVEDRDDLTAKLECFRRSAGAHLMYRVELEYEGREYDPNVIYKGLIEASTAWRS